MNKQLFVKLVAYSNNKSSTDFVYDNPLLDKELANDLAKSFVRILKVSNNSSNVNNNLRRCVLENIRKLCQIQAEGHLKIDENVLEPLTEIYNKQHEDSTQHTTDDVIDRKLDAFLVRNVKDIKINPISKSSLNPEVVQALINLNNSGNYLNQLSNDIIHWDCDKKQLKVLKTLWNADGMIHSMIEAEVLDDIAIKIKADIEKLLLDHIYQILTDREKDVDSICKSNEDLENLLKKCSISPACFQTCSGILNCLFVTGHFDLRILEFITYFIKVVKRLGHCNMFSILYQRHLQNTVLLLDIDIEVLPSFIKNLLVEQTMVQLKKLQESSKHDFIMLLSHFSHWFDLYSEKSYIKIS